MGLPASSKDLAETKVLAEVEFRWEFEQPYQLRLNVLNTRITGWIDGKEIVSIQDDSEPLRDGGFAFVCEEGLITSEEISVDPNVVFWDHADSVSGP